MKPARAPYSLVITLAFGGERTMASGHNPAIVREAEKRIVRNPKVIERIELRDLDGTLEMIWASTWELLGGKTP